MGREEGFNVLLLCSSFIQTLVSAYQYYMELNAVAFMFVTLEDKTTYEEGDGQNDEEY